MKTIALRFLLLGLILLIAIFVAVHLFSYHSPTVDLLGSYFPAWMICIVSGLTLTLIAHWIVQARHWQPYVGTGPAHLHLSDVHLHVRNLDSVLSKLNARCTNPPLQ
jgi:hypothetical protein